MTYEPGQAAVLFDFWPPEVEWFVIGGPADGDEAQTVKVKYPDIRCLGFEPNQHFGAFFPGELRREALWSEDRELLLAVPTGAERSSSVVLGGFPCPHTRVKVKGIRLDGFGFTIRNIVLWLDIEYAEHQALLGAVGLLRAGQVLLVNLETYDHLFPPIRDFLWNHGLREVKRWNDKAIGGRFDVIFKKEQ